MGRICREEGVQRLVHMSHINAREKPETAFLPGGSRFLATKWEGEMAVRSEFPGATIFRPSDVYGHGDSFINYWFSRWRKDATYAHINCKSTPLFMRGEFTVKQPVFLGDLATGVMNSLHDPEAIGQTYEAVGPQRITLHDLLTYMNGLTSRFKEEGNFKISELMLSPVSMARYWACGMLGYHSLGNKFVFYGSGLDRLERDAISDMSETGLPNLEDLGVKLHTLEQKMNQEVMHLDLYSYYHFETPDEKAVVPPPKILDFQGERNLLARRDKLGPLALLPGL